MTDEFSHGWRAIWGDAIWHCVPINDLRDHDINRKCWCEPTLMPSGKGMAQHSMDRREKFEAGRKAS